MLIYHQTAGDQLITHTKDSIFDPRKAFRVVKSSVVDNKYLSMVRRTMRKPDAPMKVLHKMWSMLVR